MSRGKKSVNITVQPLIDNKEKKLGTLVMIEDISSEKRMKSTMSRYMDSGLADKLLRVVTIYSEEPAALPRYCSLIFEALRP